jgi:arginine exporter protein ArgO
MVSRDVYRKGASSASSACFLENWTLVALSRMGVDFAQATYPVWWLMAGCGGMIAFLAWASATPWANAIAQRVAHLLAEPPKSAMLGHTRRYGSASRADIDVR